MMSGESEGAPEERELMAFFDLKNQIDQLKDALGALVPFAPKDAKERLPELHNKLDGFSARVTLVGQVKAGKTALTNALIGEPDLLPSDVNPWTSVVTTAHLNRTPPRGQRAVFKFFSQDDWTDLVVGGGRFGEMARRVNSDIESEELLEQLQAMRDTTVARLGKNFEMLLGSQHNFADFTPELVERYVCLGDVEDGDELNRQGRFADMTKSAELYLDNPKYHIPISFRDTPGVNDPFLVREQVTLRNLDNTDICIVVLSAHQALTTMDMALLRILMALKQEQIILFVNRLDELSDPVSAMSEIETHIRDTLKGGQLPASIPIVFGSAMWAEAAQTKDMDRLPKSSWDTMIKMASEVYETHKVPEDPELLAFELSGVGALQSVIAEKFGLGDAQRSLQSVRAELINTAQQSLTLLLRNRSAGDQTRQPAIDVVGLADQLDQIMRHCDAQTVEELEGISKTLENSLAEALNIFIERETAEMLAVYAKGQDISGWEADGNMLRRDLKAGFKVFEDQFQARMTDVFDTFGQEIKKCYETVLGDSGEQVLLEPPVIPTITAPLAIAKTIAMDMGGSWWNRWFGGKKSADQYKDEFQRIARAEVEPIIKEIRENHAQAAFKNAFNELREFALQHSTTLLDAVSPTDSQQDTNLTESLGLEDVTSSSIESLEEILAKLNTWHLEDGDETASIVRA